MGIKRSFATIQIPSTTNKTDVSVEDLNKAHFTIGQVQTNTAAAFKQVLQNPMTSLRIISQVALISGQPNTINHQLGQQYQGCFLSNKAGFADHYVDAVNNKSPELQVIVYVSTNVVSDIIIF